MNAPEILRSRGTRVWLCVLLILAALLAACSGGSPEATAPLPPPRVGYLSPTAGSVWADAFMDGLRDHGYVDGENIQIESRYAEGQPERFPELVAELLSLPVDVIVASTSPAVVAAKEATTQVPIVMVGVGDAVATGLVESLSRPGGNVTGVTSFSPELSVKRLELLKETVPGLARVGVLWNPGNPVKALDWRETEQAALALGLAAISLEVRRPTEFASALETAERQGCEGLLVLGDPLTVRNASAIVDLAARSRLPAIYEGRGFVEAGGLMSYAANRQDYYRRAASYVAKILGGARPADLPVERPSVFELVLNVTTARELPIAIPDAVLLRADWAVP